MLNFVIVLYIDYIKILNITFNILAKFHLATYVILIYKIILPMGLWIEGEWVGF